MVGVAVPASGAGSCWGRKKIEKGPPTPNLCRGSSGPCLMPGFLPAGTKGEAVPGLGS